MTNKQQIEEKLQMLHDWSYGVYKCIDKELLIDKLEKGGFVEINRLYDLGYRKIDENHIVIPLDGSKLVIPRKDQQTLLHAMYEQARKATAKEIFSKLREKRTKSFLDWEGNICHLDEEYVSMREIEAVLKQLGVEEQE